MHLVFLSSLWVLGALVAVPLLAHLFSKARPHRREFPSLQLLREALRHVTRVRRPRDRWLLILRTLAMLGLILGFLQPWLVSRFASASGTTKTVVLVVDVSASMAYADGTRTRLAQGTSAAEDVLATLPAHSLANVVWVQAHADSVLPEPGPNLEFLRQALRSITVRAETGDVAGALGLALKQLKQASGDRELVVLSDFQKTAWHAAQWDVPAGIRLTRISVGRETAANLGLAGLSLEPGRPVAGQEARLGCRVRNFSAESHRVTLFVEAGESRLSQALEVAPWSESPAFLTLKFPKEGLVPLKVSISEDRFPGDDVLYGLAEVRGSLQVGIAGPAENVTARVWTRAAQSLDGVTVRRLSWEQLENAGALDVLLVADWNAQASATLRAQLARGGALVLQPAEGLESAPIRALLGLPPEPGSAPLGVQVHDAPGWQLHIAQEEHPVFALFAGGAFGDPANARVRRRLVCPPYLEGKPLLAYEDGRPALTLLEMPSHTALAWWNLDLNATDWPMHSPFLAFFGEFLRHLGSGGDSGGDSGSGGASGPQSAPAPAKAHAPNARQIEPGDRLVLETGAALDPAEVRLVDALDQPVPIAAQSAGIPGVASTQPAIPGSYRWLAKDTLLDRVIVDFPESESDLRQLTKAELEQNAGAVISDVGGSQLEDLREGKPLWPWCVAGAALFLMLEGICLWRQSKKPSASDVEPEVSSV